MRTRSPSRRRAHAARLRLALLTLPLLAALYLAGPSLGLPRLLAPVLPTDVLATYRRQAVPLGLDLAGGLEVVYRVEGDDPEAPAAALSVLRARLAREGTEGAEIRRDGARDLRVQLPARDPAEFAHLRRRLEMTDLLGLHEVLAHAASPLGLPSPEALARTDAPGTSPPPTAPGTSPPPAAPSLRAPPPLTRALPSADPSGGWYLVRRAPAFTGASLRRVRVALDPSTGAPELQLETTDPGRRQLHQASTQLRGRTVAAVLGDQVVSAAVMEEEIPNGQARLRGRFDLAEARSLVEVFEAGSLPAPLTKLSERAVGPTLGAQEVRRGATAAAAGLGLVAGYMVASYGRAGALAALSVLADLVALTAALRVLDVHLTLPGLAGVALTAGMAVDACILVLERLREEAATSARPLRALDRAFARARSAIVDSNLTTLWTAGALYAFGQGPVRGFAVTLTLGVLGSMATALVLFKVLLEVDATQASPQLAATPSPSAAPEVPASPSAPASAPPPPASSPPATA